MSDHETVVSLDRDMEAQIGTLAACWGLTKEEVVRLLLEKAISDGIDNMVLEENQK